MVLTFEGHHGTSFESSQLILQNNYKLSLGDEEWLGDGAYFFVQGVSTKTVELAEKWAIAQAWDNKKKVLSYKEYCVLHSEINVDEEEFLDLTVEEGIEVLTYLVEQFEDKISWKVFV